MIRARTLKKIFLKGRILMKYQDTGNPYVKGKTLKLVVSRVSQKVTPPEEYHPPAVITNPYQTVEALQQQTGLLVPGSIVRPNEGEISNGRMLGKHYCETPEGVYYIGNDDKSRLLCDFTIVVCDWVCVVSRDTSEVNWLRVKVPDTTYSLNIREKDFTCVMDQLIDEHPDLYVPASFTGKAKQCLHEYAGEVFSYVKKTWRKTTVYSFHGWFNVDGHMQYVTPHPSFSCSKVNIPRLPVSTVAKAWRDGIDMLRIGRQVQRSDGNLDVLLSLQAILPLFLYFHAGYAAKLFEDAGNPLHFLLLLIGDSGAMKTSLCKTLAEPFNPGGILNLQSTKRAIELYREQSIDMTMILDDIFSSKDKAALSKFSDVLRVFGDGIGRAKAVTGPDTPNFTGTEQIIERGGCLVTGEHPLNSQQSSNLRTLMVLVNKQSFDGKELRVFQDDKKLAKRSGTINMIQAHFAAWIQYLECHYVELVNLIENFVPPQHEFRFKRYTDNYSILCCLAKMILFWGASVQCITEQDVERIYRLWTEVLDDFFDRNEAYAMNSDPYKQFLRALQQAMGTGSIVLASDKMEFESGNGRYIGYMRINRGEQELILAPEQAFSFVNRWLAEQGIPFVTDAGTLFKKLYDQKLSRGYENADGRGGIHRRYLKRIKLNGHLTEMLVINTQAVDVMMNKGDD